MKKLSFSLLIALFAMVSCNSGSNGTATKDNLPYYQDATFTPYWLEPDSDKLKDFHRIPNFSLVNQHGDTVTQKNLEGKIYVTDFIFTTCPSICPKMTDNMAVLQKKFKGNDQVALLSHSVTPNKDSVPQLKKYAELKGITWENWHLLTGDKKQIYDLGRKSYFVDGNTKAQKTENDFLHTENFILVDENKHIRGIYNGLNPNSIQELIEDIQTLLAKRQ